MNYAFLGRLIPAELQEEVRNLSVNNMQDAANALQWHLYEGLRENLDTEIRIINVLPIGSYPQYYKKMFVNSSVFSTEEGQKHFNVGFCNLKLIRNYILPHQVEKALLDWCKESEENRFIFLYTLYAPFLKAIQKAKQKFPMLKTCAIVADLPNMSNLSSKKGALLKFYEKKQSKSAYDLLGCIDGYALLTKHMADYMKIDKPFCVVEGISTNFFEFKAEKQHIDKEKVILYSGTLHRKFGVVNLISAFRAIAGDEYRLVICGVGDSEADIRQAAMEDRRIDFKGQLARKEVLRLQSAASVLVNPRQNTEEFTKYSFPSKNLEYLSSGIPLVAYKLDGIPDEYDEYINYAPDNSVESLCKTLIDVCEDADGRAAERAREAARFVANEKNPQKQTLKIVKMIESL